MKFIKIFLFALFFMPLASRAATNDFTVAAQLLSAAKNADIQQVQLLINNGANVNYVDSTGVSIVCTALMNNDLRAAQILQMYGADASNCDRQIKQYNSRTKPKESGGLFGGLSSAQSITLAAAGAAVIVAGLYFLTDWINPGNSNKSGSSGGERGEGGGGGSGGTATLAFTSPYGPAMINAAAEAANYATNLDLYSPSDTTSSYYKNYTMMNTSSMDQNYLLMMHGYSALARGYNGLQTLRYSDRSPVPESVLKEYGMAGYELEGGRPINVALVTANGINMNGKPAGGITAEVNSLDDRLVLWTQMNGTTPAQPEYTNFSSKYYNNAITFGSDDLSKISDATTSEDDTIVSLFDLSGNNTAVRNTSASDYDNLLAKIVGGANSGFSTDAGGDYMGFMPYGQMTIFRTGGGLDADNNVTDYYNYKALKNAVSLYVSGDSGSRSRPDIFANVDVIEPLHLTDAPTIETLLSTSATMDKSVYTTNFTAYVNAAYGDTDTTYNPGVDAYSFFYNLGSTYSPLVLFSTGAIQTNSSYSGVAVVATFENAAPLVFDNMEHLFASIVAVGQKNATTYTGTISAYSPTGKYVLTQWQDTNNTPDDTSDDKYYRARMCGIAGTGFGGLDPWCFASVGLTDELAVASAAGAFGAVKSAFPYLDNKQIFALVALTADGAYLGTLDGTTTTKDNLISYLQNLYELPNEYQVRVASGMDYLEAFKEVFGYGLINVERATTPGKSVYYYDGTNIVSDSGNAYWRAATNTAIHSSAALPMRAATITTAAYDVLESIDGSMSLPRIWESSFAIGNSGRHALYMGDVLGELKTRRDNGQDTNIGNMSFHMSRSQRAYNDNMNGLDELRLSFDIGALHMGADYQHYLTDGVSRFSGLANPILSLASNAITTNVGYDFGSWTFGARAFSGTITDDGLLENDPTISAQYTPAKLGLVNGAESSIGWNDEKFGFTTSFGFMHETNTLLGAQTDGLMAFGAGDTNYIDAELRYSPCEKISFKARGTYARTITSPDSLFISDVTDIESNAFAIGADVGNFSFAVSRPLAAYRGALKFPYAKYAIATNDDGTYAIEVKDSGVADLNFGSDKRELRFSGEYRHNFGMFTDGALGFIYRINPNNTNEFGNESIFMLKMTHRVGI